MTSRGRAGPSMAQHRRGHSTGSMAPAKARDEGLALFHEMQSHERTKYLHPSMDDLEAALTTKFGGISGYGFGASPPRMKLCSDLLGQENEKNDYDWLLTPPGTPLFPSLDKDVTAEPTSARSRPTKASSSTRSRRPSSPSVRRPSPVRPATPTARPSTPGRSSTPNARRTLSPSSSFNTSIRSSSPSRKPKPVAHPAMAALSTEQPANLRTSLPDRSSRGSALKLGASQNSDSGDARGRAKRAVSPNFSRSPSKGSTISSSGHELSGMTQRADRRSVSPINSQARKTPKVSAATPLSSRKPFDSSTRHMMTENRRPTTSGFRPLMSNNHLSSFYTRTSKPTQSATESSINSCSVHGSEEEEVASKSIDSAGQPENTADQAVKEIHMGELPLQDRERPPADVEMQDAEQVSGVLCSSDTPAAVDFRHDAVTSVRSLLQSVIDKALDLASTRESQAASRQVGTELVEARDGIVKSGVSVAVQPQCFSLLIDPEYTCSSMEVYQFDQELQTTSLEPAQRAQSHIKDMMTSGTSVVSRDSSLNLSGRSDQSKDVPGAKRASKRPFQYAPAGGPGARHHITRKKDSRESSLFSIPINSSKGDSISSGRPTSIGDTHSSVDTPRRYLDSCGSSRYMPFEDDTRSEESCVDYYIVQPSNRASRASTQNVGNFVDADDAKDYFIDGYSRKKPQSFSGDFALLEKAIETFPADAADVYTLQGDERRETRSEACRSSADLTVLDVDNELLRREEQQMEWEPVPSCEQLENGPPTEAHSKTEQDSAGTSIAACSAENLLFCSSIVHEIVYKAAALGIEKEDLKKLATPASADDLVAFLGLSNCSGGSGGSSGTGVQAPTKSTTTMTTVRQSLAYLQNQKVIQNTTVSYMQGSLGRVQEDVKAHLVGNESHPAPPQRKQKSNKCRCTIL